MHFAQTAIQIADKTITRDRQAHRSAAEQVAAGGELTEKEIISVEAVLERLAKRFPHANFDWNGFEHDVEQLTAYRKFQAEGDGMAKRIDAEYARANELAAELKTLRERINTLQGLRNTHEHKARELGSVQSLGTRIERHNPRLFFDNATLADRREVEGAYRC